MRMWRAIGIGIFGIGFVLVSYLLSFQNKQLPRIIPNQSGAMKIESPAFQNNEKLPPAYTCDGRGINPPLHLSGMPHDTKSMVLIVDDPDATIGTFDHWLLWNIPPETTAIIEGQIPQGVVGENSIGKNDYMPPCPPSGEHRYTFKIYALDTLLAIPPSSTVKTVEKAMEGHVLDSAKLIGLYQRG